MTVTTNNPAGSSDAIPNNNKKIVIIGGAGYVGRYLVHYLLNRYPQSEILVITRNTTKSLLFPQTDRLRIMNRIRPPQVNNSYIINLAFSSRFTSREALHEARQLLDDITVALGSNYTGVLTHVSTIAVHGHAPKPDVVQPKDLRRTCKADSYSEVKGFMERALSSLARQKRLRLNIVRCGNVMGPGSAWAVKIATRLVARKPLIGALLEHPSNSTFIGNLVYALAALADYDTNQDICTSIMNFCEFGPTPWNRWIKSFTDVIGLPAEPWPTDDIRHLTRGLLPEIYRITRDVLRLAIPLYDKAPATHAAILKLLNYVDGTHWKTIAKQFTTKPNSGRDPLDNQEYRAAQVYLATIPFSLEGVPRMISDNLPYSFERAQTCLANWVRFSEYALLTSF